MRLNREKLLNLWDLEDMPACDAGMQLVQAFLLSCGEAVDRFGEEGPEDRLAQITASYMALVDHGNICDDCNEAEVPAPVEATERAEEDKLQPVDESSDDYKQGFRAGENLEPLDDSKSAVWQRGWADAEE
ncbi:MULTISPECIES: hypothetical protein [Acidobacteriaceae]|uniref:hypothetical protein n=1 Tax=Acidobacteriaceae TaxID=204434 RepID=UPI00131C8F95|nr:MULTISPECIES: hypothetical protein [Acidobacteriaceae]MDW5266960.1 hypothetical protein [Edaphobacter sp.]